ncbi:MAG: hypothetical protein E7571_08215 [Ruminococcaceae bacterium]|nr:hypothetical protein [Oscillospiraceae bacterium]
MKKSLNVIFPIIAVIAGIIFIISGIHTYKNKDLYDSTVTATVVEVVEDIDTVTDPENPETTYTVYIDYEVDGTKYEHVESPESDSTMKEGDTIEILYQSKDPSKITAKNVGKTSLIFIVLGAIVAIGGGFSVFRAFIKR